MAATEAQRQALAKARAARQQKLSEQRALAAQAQVETKVAEIESEADVLRVEALLQQALDSVGVRRADGSGLMHDRCMLCESRGVHHVTPMLCDCWCHKAREVLGGVARAA